MSLPQLRRPRGCLDLAFENLLRIRNRLTQPFPCGVLRTVADKNDPFDLIRFVKIIWRRRVSSPSVRFVIDGEERIAGPADMILMFGEALRETRSSLQDAIEFSAADRKVARGPVRSLNGAVTYD